MPDPKKDQGSEPSKDTPAQPDFGKFTDAVTTLASAVKSLESRGASAEAAKAAVADQAGISAEDLEKLINDADAKGELGKGVMQVAQTVAQALRAETLDREGHREVESLGNRKEFAEAFDKDGPTVFETYSPGFHEWMVKNRYQYAALASPQKATELFKYYLAGCTDYQTKREDVIRKREAEKVTKERSPGSPTSPSLRPGASPEGGIGPRLVAGAYTGVAEASPEQDAVMDAFGLSKEQKAHAIKAQGTKTAMGTPLDFVTTHNEGGV